MRMFVTDTGVVAPLNIKERAIAETLQKEKFADSFWKSAERTLSSDKLKKTIVDMLSLLKKDKLEKVHEMLHKVVVTCLDEFTSADWNSCKKTFDKISNYDDWVRVVFEISMVIVIDIIRKSSNNEFSGFQIG